MPSYGSSAPHSNNNSGYGYSKSNQQEKLVNVSVTLHGPVSKDQLYKIQEVLRHPSQYRDQIKPEDRPVKGEYATALNKFHPKKVEVNEATVKEAIKYGQFLKKSKEDIADEWSRNLQLTVLYMSLKLPHFAHHNVVWSLTSRLQLCCIQYRMCGYGLISRANYKLVNHV